MTVKVNRVLILDEILNERNRQDKKWGVQNHKPIEWVAILTEEVGEVAKEALDHHFKNREMTLDNYRTELIQVAAVAISMIESLDRSSGK